MYMYLGSGHVVHGEGFGGEGPVQETQGGERERERGRGGGSIVQRFENSVQRWQGLEQSSLGGGRHVVNNVLYM